MRVRKNKIFEGLRDVHKNYNAQRNITRNIDVKI